MFGSDVFPIEIVRYVDFQGTVYPMTHPWDWYIYLHENHISDRIIMTSHDLTPKGS